MNDALTLAARLQETLDENKEAEVIAVMGTRRDWKLIIAALKLSAGAD